MNYIHLIKKLNKTKYQNYFNSKKSFLKAYISNRKLLIKKLHKITYKDRSNLKNSKFKIKKFRYNNTYNDLLWIANIESYDLSCCLRHYLCHNFYCNGKFLDNFSYRWYCTSGHW